MEKIAKFNWEDPFLLSEQLTEDERMIADSARAFAREKLLPRVADAFVNETVAPEIFAEMGEQGLLGVTIKPEYGGAGASYVSYGLVAREVEAVDSGYRSMMSVAIFPGYAPYQYIWFGRAKAEISAQTGQWRVDWLFRLDRARRRLRSGWHAHLCEKS